MITDNLLERQPKLWLSLLQELSETTSDWMTMKGVASALSGVGDVDSIAPKDAWPVIADTFTAWARREGLGPVVLCPHAPHLMHLVAVSDLRPELFELDVNARKIYFGSTLFRPRDVASMAIVDEGGFRRLRPGAEGLLKLLQNGSTRSGRPVPEKLEAKGVVPLLRSDPDGVRAFAERFGLGASAAVRAAEAAAAGSWDRKALLEARAACLARAPLEPDAIAARIRFRWQATHCPVLRVVVTGHRRVTDRDAWLREVEQTHKVRR